MLIRSQDKKSLINFSNVSMIYSSGNKVMIDFNDSREDGYMTIGVYATEDKTLKVMDMIENANFKIEKMKMIYSNSGKLANSCICDFTFKVPQDSDVAE